ncbi:SDR family NAD(P)-dependent oxidoreductase [Vibrio mediterranei]|uniref:SDR family NAD(P)-dependent oxidoreductase n=1 Tax=Vibrio mediterranei TaxID=689 RepID=UPI0017B7267A|nr:SDR family NAD(P)-dependent oxidoreductase [Vibrio mediterranei]NUW71327.1 SDR family NAD(P)-dependent oxidoreductase [Vibrio mediterranei]
MQKIALVTGAYQGIGLATSELLMEQGFHVIMADIQSCSALVNDFRQKGYTASHLKLDLAMSSVFPAVANKIEEQFGRLDVLVNNAAILVDLGRHPSLIDEDTYRRVIEVNQIGPFLLTRALTPLLKKSPQARIVNVSSQAGQLAQLSDMASPIKDDVCAAYQSSKIGVNANTVLFAKELEPFGIKVNSYCPGWVDSGMNLDELPDYGEHIRLKSPKEGADTAIWLATLDADGPTAGFFSEREKINW